MSTRLDPPHQLVIGVSDTRPWDGNADRGISRDALHEPGCEIDNGRDCSRVVVAWRGYAIARPLLRPGAQEDTIDVQELIEHGARTVVLSKGVWERLQVCPETLEVLSKNDIQVQVLQTEAAVERFNELRENIAVGGLFHSTC